MKSARFTIVLTGIITAVFAANAITSPPAENAAATDASAASQPAAAAPATTATAAADATATAAKQDASAVSGVYKPSEVPISWELTFTYIAPKPILIKPPGEAKERLFWYMPYRVLNNTGDDRLFIPHFCLYTNTGQMLLSDQNCPSGVFDAVKKRLNNPLLKDTTAITGKLLQGRDNAKDGVAIWPDFDPKAGTFDIFVGGLSGETIEATPIVTIPNTKTPLPTTGPAAVALKPGEAASQPATISKVYLTKTLDIRYLSSSDAASRINTPVTFIREEWVMR